MPIEIHDDAIHLEASGVVVERNRRTDAIELGFKDAPRGWPIIVVSVSDHEANDLLSELAKRMGKTVSEEE